RRTVRQAAPVTVARRTRRRQSTPPTSRGAGASVGEHQPRKEKLACHPWSARHRKTAIFGWLAFVVAAVVLGGAIGTKQLTDEETLPGESGRAARMLD